MITQLYVAFPDPADGTWVTDRRQIVRRYMRCARARGLASTKRDVPILRDVRGGGGARDRTWFAIDILSILPFDTVGMMTEDKAVATLKERVFRLLIGFRLGSLPLMMRAGSRCCAWSGCCGC